ncbi:MAG: hypothetical protein HEQ21_14455 [Blastomonas sp.]|uniref:hypothetical protein n=1 Tax=Blastomonas sp. TaxID=1909299 RepID=UPI002590A060|nr:hypothetical protein [Blastomonas sp.]MCO5794020.1 hypothetical protein [Blastomonas sp.]
MTGPASLHSVLDTMTGDRLDGALTALDHVSRPLEVREIEKALRLHGVSKSRAVIIATSVRKLGIIAVVGSEVQS